MTFRFESPWLLWLMVPPVLVYGWWLFRELGMVPKLRSFRIQTQGRANDCAGRRAGYYARTEVLVASGLVAQRWKLVLVPTLRCLALFCVVLALARPQSGQVYRERKASGVDILLAIDVSGSMQALDFEIKGERADRLTMLKTLAAEFIAKRPNDRIGIVAFGADAFTLCPLTLDHGLLRDYLDELEIGMGGDGTAIGQAVGLVTKRLSSIESKAKLAVLLTDGDNTAGALDPRIAAEIAHQKGIKIYTVAIGQEGPVPVAVPGFFGQNRLVQRVFPVDLKLLQDIASTTGAVSYQAKTTDELRGIYDRIDEIEKTDFKIKERARYAEQMHWFALAALVFLLAATVLSGCQRTRRAE